MKKYAIIGITIGIGIAISAIGGYYVYSQPSNNPWDDMSCEEMINLAMSPEHQTFTEQQHMQFHMKLMPCIENMNAMHNMSNMKTMNP